MSARPKFAFAHYMMSNRDYGNFVSGYARDIADAQGMGLDGFALNCGGWNAANYKADTESMFLAAEQQAAASPGLPPFKLFFSADMTGLTYPEIVQMMTAYAARPNYLRVPSVPGGTDARPVLSTWGGEGGWWEGPGGVKDRWTSLVLSPLRAQGINAFFVPLFFLTDAQGGHPTPTPQSYAAQAAGLHKGLSDGVFLGSVAGGPPNAAALTSLEASAAAVRAQGLLVMSGASPQYWLSKIKAQGRYYVEYRGGESLYEQFNSLLTVQQADWLELFTWNDFDESTWFSPIDDVTKYWPYTRIPYQGYYPQRPAVVGETTWFLKCWKAGQWLPITGDAAYAYARTAPNSLQLADPDGPVYSGQYTSVTTAPDALDDVFVTTRLAAPATIEVTTGGQVQRADAPAGLSHSRFPFQVGAQSVKVLRGGQAALTLTLPPVTTTPPTQDYNFHYAQAAASAPYAAPRAALGAAMLDFDILLGPALSAIAENSATLAAGSDGFVHALLSATRSDTGAALDLSGATLSGCLVPPTARFDPAKYPLAPLSVLVRTALPGAGRYLALPVGPDGLAQPLPGPYLLYAQIALAGETVGVYSSAPVTVR